VTYTGRTKVRRRLALVFGLIASSGLLAQVGAQSQASTQSRAGTLSDGGRLLVTQVTTSPEWSSGEGWIIVDPRNPQLVTAVWTSFPYKAPGAAITTPPGPSPVECGVGYSTDGGRTWDVSALPYQRVGLPVNPGGCADPTLADAPDGTLYSVFDGGSVIPGVGTSYPTLASLDTVSASRDQGRTWSQPKTVWSVEYRADNTVESRDPDAEFDRPWLVIDPVTRTLYASFSDDALVQRVVLASHDDGVTWGPAYPLDPDFQSIWGDTISAAFGVVAAAYTVDPNSLEYKASHPPEVTCNQACAVFETSTSDGKTWSRTVMPVDNPPVGSTPTTLGLEVAADPSTKGRFAVVVPQSSDLQVWVTSDTGATWKLALTANVPGGDTLLHTWVGFGSTSALGVVWRIEHADKSYDVYADVSPDGGTTFGPQVELTPSTAPPDVASGAPGDDCACNLYLDGKYLYTSWGDSRTGQRQLWFARYDWAGQSAPSSAVAGSSIGRVRR